MANLFGSAQFVARRDVDLPERRMVYWLLWEGLPSGTGAYFIRCLSTGRAGEPQRVALSGDLGNDRAVAMVVFLALTEYPPVDPERLAQAAQQMQRVQLQGAHLKSLMAGMARPSDRYLRAVSQYHAASLLARLEAP